MNVYESILDRMIEFFVEHDDIKPDLKGYEDWICRLGESHGQNISNITYILSTDSHLLDLNRQYLEHDFFTDVLTFDLGTGGELAGDIYISLDRVMENAAEQDLSWEEELRRVMAHGLLHLLGEDDSTKQEILRMRELENEALELFHVKQ